MSIEDRIPEMSEKELQTLHDNAERLSQGAPSKQRDEAERLLPIIAGALNESRKARVAEAAEKKAVRQKEMAAARAKRARTRKAEAEAAATK